MSDHKWIGCYAETIARLERELADGLQTIDALSKQADEEERSKEVNALLVDRYRNERDEANALLTQCGQEREHNANQAMIYKAERDEARECLRYLRDHDIYDTLTRHDKAKIANALKEGENTPRSDAERPAGANA
jgi:hypothetical protein